MCFNQLPRELTCCCDANLLAQDSADSDLESIPPAGRAQTRTLPNQVGERGIGAEMFVDCADVGS
jgi:hypothetical protein